MKKSRSVHKFIRNRLVLHVLFWILSFYILLHHFSISSEITPVDYIFTALFHVSIVVTVYINLYILIPYFLNRQQYPVYVLSLAILFLLFYGLHLFIFDIMSEILFPGYYLITFYDFIELLKYFIIYIGLTTLFILSRYWFELLDSKKKLAEAEKTKIQHELTSLKAQVNPHFLFNSLNTVYSLALRKSENTADAVLQLSDVLRYMIYESGTEKVPLQKELDFIKEYIALQKLRSQAAGEIKFSEEGEVKGQMVAPLIFIVFIENAFKHGLKGDIHNQFLNIRFQITEKEIVMEVENNRGTSGEIKQSDHKGLGLENVKRRLELMYPRKHYLVVSENHDKFMIRLVLQI